MTIEMPYQGLLLRVRNRFFFIIFNQNIRCEHHKNMLKPIKSSQE